MNKKTEAKVLRVLLASLVGSELSPRELRELGTAFSHEPDLVIKLGRLLEEVGESLEVEHLKSTEPGKSWSAFQNKFDLLPEAEREHFVEHVISLTKSRRVTKKELLMMMGKLGPFNLQPNSARDTMREMVERFALRAPPADIQRFVEALESGDFARSAPDPYFDRMAEH